MFWSHFINIFKDFYRGLWSVFTSEFQNKGAMTQEQRRKTAGRNRRRGFITRKRARDYPPPHSHPMHLQHILQWSWKKYSTGARGLSLSNERTPKGLLEFLLPLFKEGSFRGMLIIPTKSSVGTRERRIDLIRMASPFPVWISYNAGLENEIEEWSHPHSSPPQTSSQMALEGVVPMTLHMRPTHSWSQWMWKVFTWFFFKLDCEGYTLPRGNLFPLLWPSRSHSFGTK